MCDEWFRRSENFRPLGQNVRDTRRGGREERRTFRSVGCRWLAKRRLSLTARCRRQVQGTQKRSRSRAPVSPHPERAHERRKRDRQESRVRAFVLAFLTDSRHFHETIGPSREPPFPGLWDEVMDVMGCEKIIPNRRDCHLESSNELHAKRPWSC